MVYGLNYQGSKNKIADWVLANYFGKSQWQFPTAEAYAKMQTFMPLPRDYEALFGLDGDSGADIRSLISLEGLSYQRRKLQIMMFHAKQR